MARSNSEKEAEAPGGSQDEFKVYDQRLAAVMEEIVQRKHNIRGKTVGF